MAKLFGVAWVLLFAVYFPAARAGFVADFTGWLDQEQRYGFWDNINRTHYIGQSLYQFTQLNTWIVYKILGVSAWGWHLLFLSLHALNATLLWRISVRLLTHAGVENAERTGLTGMLFYLVTPYVSEAVVWEPAFHFLQGMLLILLVLHWTQCYITTCARKYAVLSCGTFLLSTFSLEIFYITPWLVLALALFYRFFGPTFVAPFRKVLVFVFVPFLVMFVLHLLLFHAVYSGWVAHVGASTVTDGMMSGWGKPAKHVFHILALGRFLPLDDRLAVYAWCDSKMGIVLCYGVLAALSTLILIRFPKMTGKGKVLSLFFIWVCIHLAILIPLWFERIFVVVYDRYVYFTCGFLFMFVAISLSYITLAYLRITITGLYLLVNLRFAIQVNRYWMKSARVIDSLLRTFPYETNKTVVLLNLPQNMHGIPMIGAEKQSEFQLMHDLLRPGEKTKTTIYDAMAYNMETPDDGAQATFIDDSTVQVTLNQWGTWWWYAMQGGSSYGNKAYRIEMTDAAHSYKMVLKQPAAQYLLLLEVGDHWVVVKTAKK